ncbi:MAG: 2-C-methyl-D-erythritol 4-phosphate cytidylyltransferase [Betaproteobacteria bacterium]
MNTQGARSAKLWALVPAAGGGTRFGGATPKQYAPLSGRPLLAWTLDCLRDALPLAGIAVNIVPDDAHYDRMIGVRTGVTVLREGGRTRGETVRNGLQLLATSCADDDWILVHDAARPCVPRAALQRLVAILEHDAVGGLLAVPVADTLKRGDDAVDAPRVLRTEDRAQLWRAQTPQMFRYGLLMRALACPGADECTDEAQAVEALGLSARLVQGSRANIKVTFPDDLQLAAAILAAQANDESPP